MSEFDWLLVSLNCLTETNDGHLSAFFQFSLWEVQYTSRFNLLLYSVTDLNILFMAAGGQNMGNKGKDRNLEVDQWQVGVFGVRKIWRLWKIKVIIKKRSVSHFSFCFTYYWTMICMIHFQKFFKIVPNLYAVQLQKVFIIMSYSSQSPDLSPIELSMGAAGPASLKWAPCLGFSTSNL